MRQRYLVNLFLRSCFEGRFLAGVIPVMVEVEAKIVLPDCGILGTVEEKLRSLGAVPEAVVVEEDTYYQHPCRDFSETDEALRIRRVNGSAELTYKGPKRVISGSKAREELTIKPVDVDAMDKLLRVLGFHPVAVVRKERRYYRFRETMVSLDQVDELGCFVEVEYRGLGGIEDAAREIDRVLEELGLAKYPRTTKSYLELILEKKPG